MTCFDWLFLNFRWWPLAGQAFPNQVLMIYWMTELSVSARGKTNIGLTTTHAQIHAQLCPHRRRVRGHDDMFRKLEAECTNIWVIILALTRCGVWRVSLGGIREVGGSGWPGYLWHVARWGCDALVCFVRCVMLDVKKWQCDWNYDQKNVRFGPFKK